MSELSASIEVETTCQEKRAGQEPQEPVDGLPDGLPIHSFSRGEWVGVRKRNEQYGILLGTERGGIWSRYVGRGNSFRWCSWLQFGCWWLVVSTVLSQCSQTEWFGLGWLAEEDVEEYFASTERNWMWMYLMSGRDTSFLYVCWRKSRKCNVVQETKRVLV